MRRHLPRHRLLPRRTRPHHGPHALHREGPLGSCLSSPGRTPPSSGRTAVSAIATPALKTPPATRDRSTQLAASCGSALSAWSVSLLMEWQEPTGGTGTRAPEAMDSGSDDGCGWMPGQHLRRKRRPRRRPERRSAKGGLRRRWGNSSGARSRSGSCTSRTNTRRRQLGRQQHTPCAGIVDSFLPIWSASC